MSNNWALYTYTIPFDDGAAPNPFGGVCTLAICKPAIRRTASKGDWIAGFGSSNDPNQNDLSGKLVYAMKVTDKMTLKEYNQIAHEKWPIKVPDITSQDLRKKLGDCLYFSFNESNTEANQRAGVHDLSNVKTDLGGEHVLISDEFYYFGANPIAMPDHDGLHDILHQTQGHKRQANNAYKEAFKKWLFSLGYQNGQHGWPAMNLDWSNNNGGCGNACSTRLAIAKEDEKFERLSKC